MTRRLRHILVGVFFVLMFAYAGTSAYRAVRLLTGSSYLGWKATQIKGRIEIGSVRRDGPATVLEPGDQVLAIKSQQQTQPGVRTDGDWPVKSGTEYVTHVLRGGVIHEYSLETTPFPFSFSMGLLVGSILLPAVFLIMGLAIYLLKPNDKQVLLISLLFGMAIFSNYYSYFSFAGLSALLAGMIVVGRTVSIFAPVVAFHVSLVFPGSLVGRLVILNRLPRLERYIYLPTLGLVPFVCIFNVLLIHEPGRAIDFSNKYSFVRSALSIQLVVFLTAALASLTLNYRRANYLARRRMRVALGGTLAATLPIILLNVVDIAVPPSRLDAPAQEWFRAVALSSLILLPLSITYAVIRHKVIPVSLIIRRGVRYVFVSRGSVVLEMVTVFTALTLFLDVVFTHHQTTSVLVIGIVSGAGSVALWNLTSLLHRRVIAPAIDRRFFRQAYNAHQVLSALGQSLRSVADTSEMVQSVCSTVKEALQAESVHIFLRDDVSGDFIGHDLGSSALPQAHSVRRIVLPHDSSVVEQLSMSRQPLEIDFEDNNFTSTGESETYGKNRPEIFLPIAARHELLGVMALGPRLGDLPYSREDRQMLMAVSLQMALTVENSKLIKQVVEEESLRRELSMAWAVQRRLLPERPPAVASLELAGICRPARQIGGDYYDFIDLGNDKIAVTIADVAGKGISAALVMSMLQASLRAQAGLAIGCPSDLAAALNAQLIGSTDLHVYATLFYGEFDCSRGLLTYVNAGHNPPMLFRDGSHVGAEAYPKLALAAVDSQEAYPGALATASTALVQPLTVGGSVIGILPGSRYEQETIQLLSGDLIVAYTDGVTEALSRGEEEFGESGLRAAISKYAHLPAAELSEKVVEAITRWSLDMPQHDDLTLLVVKVK